MSLSPSRALVRFPAALLLLFLGTSIAVSHDGDDHGGGGGGGEGCSPIPFPYLPPFMDALPIPQVAVPTRYVTNYCVPIATNLCVEGVIPVYEMPMVQFPHRFHRLLPEVDVWGYDSTYPGPTIEAQVNQPIVVNWVNALPSEYPDWLLANTNLHGVHGQSVQTVVHLHGAAVLPRYDGYPTNYFGTGSSDEYFYSNIDFNGDGETLWYHDHALGRTANNVYAGLAGFYLLRNPALEAELKLPTGDYEIPLAIQDRDIQLNRSPASLYTGNTTTNGGVPWHYHAVVNGMITPYLEVEPTRYRFRILNGAPFRTFGLHLAATDLNGGSINGALTPPPFTIIGTESGYLPSPTNVVSSLGTPGIRMMPGERIDVVIDFTP